MRAGDAAPAGPGAPAPALARGLGLVQALALNMTNIIGVGPFITIPLIIAAMGGPQCMLGWLLGAVLALADGLVWSELAAAYPESGGTYVYLTEAFGGTRLGAALPFLFVWQFVLSGPLEIASGFIGFAQYAGYLWPGLGPWGTRATCVAVGLLTIVLAHRRIGAVGRVVVALWVGVLATVLVVIASGLAHFDARVAFDFPPGAFRFSAGFAAGLGSAMLIAMYDFMGYYDICYVAGEVRDPRRVLPRAILGSVAIVAVLYALMNLSIIGVVPWREAMRSTVVVADFMERLHGPRAATAVTALVLWTALASVLALLLGYSRIAYAAAARGDFFRAFARVHPTGHFPHVAVRVLGGLAILFAFLPLGDVISALLTSRILVQFVAQVAAVRTLRRRGVPLPFRMWGWPLPAVVALLGWSYVFAASGWRFVALGMGTLVLGGMVFLLRGRVRLA